MTIIKVTGAAKQILMHLKLNLPDYELLLDISFIYEETDEKLLLLSPGMHYYVSIIGSALNESMGFSPSDSQQEGACPRFGSTSESTDMFERKAVWIII